MPKISLLIPTRKRPESLKRFYKYATENADKPDELEFVVFIDSDDDSYDGIWLENLRKIRGEGYNLAECWNICAEVADGDIMGLFGDDVIIKTKGWDTIVKETFDATPDKIAFVFGDDGSDRGKTYGTHGFLHRNWVDVVGRFVPPYFSAGYVDTWLNDVSTMVNRHIFVNIDMEHLHQGFGKAEDDETYQVARQRTEADQVEAMYLADDKKQEREAEAQKLTDFMLNA